jgi:DNA-binding transcriptional LysR family regulator
LPPPNSLVAFEAAARSENFTLAARELRVTQAAVSHQIKNLETDLGLRVFHRLNGKVKLTEEGERLFRSVVIGLEQNANTVSELKRHAARPHLTIAATLSFAGFWLMPRIATFRDEFPHLDLRFVAADGELDLAGEAIDLAVKYGDGNWPGFRAELLFRPDVFPVCSPSLLSAGKPLRSLSDLSQQTLLERDSAGSFGVTWAEWLAAVGGDSGQIKRRLYFNNYEVMIRAAVEGQGIALGFRPLIDQLLKQKVLVRPIDLGMRPRESYYLVTADRLTANKHRDTFCAWLTRQISRDA